MTTRGVPVHRVGYAGANIIDRQEIPQKLRFDLLGVAEGGTPPLGSHGHQQEQTFTAIGAVSTKVYEARWYPTDSITLIEVKVGVNTAPTGSSLIVVLRVNGVAKAATQTTVAAGANVGTTDGFNLNVPEGSYVQVEVTQKGSTVAGSDMTVMVRYR